MDNKRLLLFLFLCTIQYSTIQYSTIQYNTIQFVAQFSYRPSFRTKKLSLIIFIGRSNLRQPKYSENNGNISAINIIAGFGGLFDEEAGQCGQFLSR